MAHKLRIVVSLLKRSLCRDPLWPSKPEILAIHRKALLSLGSQQWAPAGSGFPRGHLAVSGDILVVTGGGATGMQWEDIRDGAKRPVVRRSAHPPLQRTVCPTVRVLMRLRIIALIGSTKLAEVSF